MYHVKKGDEVMGPIPMYGMHNYDEPPYSGMENHYHALSPNNTSFYSGQDLRDMYMLPERYYRDNDMYGHGIYQPYIPHNEQIPPGYDSVLQNNGPINQGYENYQPYPNTPMNGYDPYSNTPGMDYLEFENAPQNFGHQAYNTIPPHIGNHGLQYGQGMFNGPLPFPQPQGGYPYGAKPMTNSPFANPLENKKVGPQMGAQFPSPYPNQSFMQKSQPSGFKSIMNQFKTQDGTVDVTKMMNTAGQMMGTVSQMQNVFKGIGGFFKAT